MSKQNLKLALLSLVVAMAPMKKAPAQDNSSDKKPSKTLVSASYSAGRHSDVVDMPFIDLGYSSIYKKEGSKLFFNFGANAGLSLNSKFQEVYPGHPNLYTAYKNNYYNLGAFGGPGYNVGIFRFGLNGKLGYMGKLSNEKIFDNISHSEIKNTDTYKNGFYGGLELNVTGPISESVELNGAFGLTGNNIDKKVYPYLGVGVAFKIR